MSDQIRSSVFIGREAAVHTGNGNQIILLGETTGKDPRRIADDQLSWFRQRFLPPGDFTRAGEVLESCGTVFLDGTPGTGRRTAAWILLGELYSGSETFHELLLRDKAPYLNTSQVGEGALVLVDLSTITSEQVWTEVQDELPDLRKVVHEHGAHLVVVLPTRRVERLGADLGAYRVKITRPAGRAVLQRYLRMEGIPVAETDSAPQAAADFLIRKPSMQEIADFAALVVEARTTAGSAGGFASWCENALAVLDNHQGNLVAKDLAELRQGPQRALLLATAMLHGAHIDVVHRATAAMMEGVEHPQDERPLLERADLDTRFQEIKATPDAFGRVRFDRLGYDSAVRVHFWTHRPELREPIQKWVGDTVGLTGLETEDRDKLIKRFAEQCLHDRYRDLLLTLVSQCAKDIGNGFRMDAAVQALRQGLQHEQHGRFFRQKIYDWSRETILPRGLTQVLVVACWQVMAVRHPDQAMVRLHHLARRERGTTHAHTALVQLVGADAQLRVRMLERLVKRLQLEEWPIDADLFLEFADPAPLTAAGPRTRAPLSDPALREQLITGWSIAFQRRPYEVWRTQAERWIRAAFEEEPHREHLLDTLVAGGEQRADLLARLHVITRDLARLGTDGQERHNFLVDRVLRKINFAMGIGAA
ncbi:hypothetical protein [Streptosporangium amethystogenes]|uniref:hypothetical protein n=1 Tax=Streptosporangium amethystogenes TaxID=2002 RepID=UPI00068A5CB9|nr:hypothetical protein [Streptosporangium amethystogenes]